MFLLLKGLHPVTGDEIERPVEVYTHEEKDTGEIRLDEIRELEG